MDFRKSGQQKTKKTWNAVAMGFLQMFLSWAAQIGFQSVFAINEDVKSRMTEEVSRIHAATCKALWRTTWRKTTVYGQTLKLIVCIRSWQRNCLVVKMMDRHISCFHVGKPLHQSSDDVGVNVVMAPTSLPKQLMQIDWWVRTVRTVGLEDLVWKKKIGFAGSLYIA